MKSSIFIKQHFCEDNIMYLIRLDDASEYMDINKWVQMEKLLDKYNIKPIFGIIPANQDPNLLSYGKVDEFWKLIIRWKKKGWVPALHGYTHVFETNDGGLNPVNDRSEFAGVSLKKQCQKIRDGVKILQEHEISPEIFFAPAHTFDKNTMKALKSESEIRVISDTVANDVYYQDGFYFVPQQSGHCRRLPFKMVTFCYHPNIMEKKDFMVLNRFLSLYKDKFLIYHPDILRKRKFGVKETDTMNLRRSW